MKPLDLIEDVEFLMLVGEWPDRAAKRLGYKSLSGLERRLHALGRRDLAGQLRQRDCLSLAYRLAHNTPMDEVVARDKRRYEEKKRGKAA